MLKRINVAIALLGLIVFSGALIADVPFFWLDKPKGRSNKNDPKSPLFYVTDTPVVVGGNTATPTASRTATRTPTIAVGTSTATPTNAVGTPTATPTNAVGTPTSTPTPTTAPVACTTAGPGSLVASFENHYCDGTEYGQALYVSIDGFGTTSSPAVWAASAPVAPPASGNSSSYAACVSGTMVQENGGSSIYPYADLQMPLNASANVNISGYSPNSGLSFDFRAAVAGVQYKVSFYQGFADPYQIRFTPNDTNWHTYNVYFPGVSTSGLKFAQPSWATPTAWSPSIQRIDVGPVASASGAVAYDYCIDNVTFNAPAPPPPYPASKFLAAEYSIAKDEWGGDITATDVDGTSTISGYQGAGSSLGGGTSLGSFCISGSIGAGANPYAVGVMKLNAAGTSVDISAASTNQSVQFSYKANVLKTFRIRISSPSITDYDYYHFDVTPTDTAWHNQVIYFPGTAPAAQCFAQGGWGAAVPWSTVAADVTSMDLMVFDPAGSYDVCIDDFDFDAPAGPGGGGSTGWPTVYDGDNVALGTNFYMAITGTGQGGVVESTGTGAHGSGTFAHVTLAASGYAGAAVFNTGYDAGSVPQFHDASSGNPDGVVSVEISLRIPASAGNCYPPAVKLVSDDGVNQYQSMPVTITPYIVETGGVASGPAIMKADTWYTARIPLSVFLGDNGQAAPDNHNFVNADLAKLHGVAVQPLSGTYDGSGAFTGEIDVDDLKLVTTAASAVSSGMSTVVDTFESVKGQALWGNYWSLNVDPVTCHSPVSVLNFGTNGQSPVDAGGNTNGSACHSGHLYGYLTQANGDYGPDVPPCSSAANDYGFLNTSASLDPASTASTFYGVDLSNNTRVPSLPAGGATGLRLWLKRGPNCGNTVIKVFIERTSANNGDQFYVLIRTADISATAFQKFELPFPNDGAQTTTGGAWPPPAANNTAPAAGGTECHTDAGDPAIVSALTSSELWWGQAWYYGTKKTWGRTDFTQVGVGAIERGSTVDVYIDDVEFY